MAKVIAMINHKGGVGKTTSTASIGAALARDGRKVLLVDIDAQANLSISLGRKKGLPEESIYEALRDEKLPPVMEIAERLDLIPSALDLAELDMFLYNAVCREFRLKELLSPFRNRYDYILIDCPPSLGILVINALVAADYVLIPSTAEALPYIGIDKIYTAVEMVRKRINGSLKVAGILLTRWEGRNLNKAIAEELKEGSGLYIFDAKIRTNIALAEAPLNGGNIYDYAPNSNGAADYKAAADELTARLNEIDNEQ